jgi:hypothetical protein
VKEARVKVVMADLALTQLANRSVEALTTPEYRRLTIGVQLVRDPGDIFIYPSPLFSYLYQTVLFPFSTN